jgi:glutamate-1-semialdehyde 2,1-aminomutase
MSTTEERVDIDLGWVEELTKRETAALDEKHARSLSYRQEAMSHLPGGVSSSWQTWPPHPIYVDRGLGAHVWDIDGNEYVDYHNGYGVMVMGHAHPKIVEAVQKRVALGTHFAQPTEDALPVAEQLAERTGLPYWRFGNSGTEATLDAVRIMRASTGRDMILKIEGTYHGHHDALMVSVFPSQEDAGPRDNPNSVPQTKGLIPGTTESVLNVPFNDLEAAAKVFAARGSEIAGMIIEPVMTNCGVVLPEDGYLQGLKDLCRANGAMFAYDEVKTGFTVAWGGAIEAFGVTPDLVAFAKALGAGLPCGAIGGTEEAMAGVISGEIDQVGTFNGNPLTMAAARTNLEEVLTKDAYVRLDEINTILHGCETVMADHHLPASMKTLAAKGSIDWSPTPIREYRDLWAIDDRIPQLAWLWQLNRGVFKSPGSKWESWTTSIVMSDDDAQRYVDNFESFAQAITQRG